MELPYKPPMKKIDKAWLGLTESWTQSNYVRHNKKNNEDDGVIFTNTNIYNLQI